MNRNYVDITDDVKSIQENKNATYTKGVFGWW